jgi:hypothetical protein
LKLKKKSEIATAISDNPPHTHVPFGPFLGLIGSTPSTEPSALSAGRSGMAELAEPLSEGVGVIVFFVGNDVMV